ATGSIAAAGTLGALIPPSILLILYGIFVQVPINQLFVGGSIIGIITALSYVLIIIGRVLYNPELAPRIDETPPLSERIAKLLDTWPIVILVLLVLGGMFSGLFTATEAAAVGALLALIFAAVRGQLTKEATWRSIVDTLSTTGTLFIISVGANLLTRFLALTGTSELIASTIIGLELSGAALLVGITVLYLLLGMFLEPLGAMLLTLPVLLPILDKANIDLIWFGIFLVKLLEVGMITPPIGINVFVIKSAVGDIASLGTIFRGVLWFIVADLAVVALIIAAPEIITYLPSLMAN
ncbi:C4-dicarboxylate ABC transporter, partial [Hoeflea sp. BAL378]|uniref:TRAP transporter large permease subunit n=1 Tax=Hoeflea sp. BAL378 TaxID=1547437 RepID=UPI00051451E9